MLLIALSFDVSDITQSFKSCVYLLVEHKTHSGNGASNFTLVFFLLTEAAVRSSSLLENFAIFTGKQLCLSLFLIKLQLFFYKNTCGGYFCVSLENSVWFCGSAEKTLLNIICLIHWSLFADSLKKPKFIRVIMFKPRL